MTDNGMSAVLLKLTEHAERLAQLDHAVTANLDECQVTTAGLGGAITDLRSVVETQGQLLAAIDEMVKGIVPLPDDEPAKGYTPRPSVHWWAIKDDERAKAITRLAAWVDQVWRPFYGHLAAMLGDCWRDHPLCLVGLDWLSELHSVLYFQPKRTASLLSAQAEYQTRIVPAIAEQFRAETSRCTHRPAATGGRWGGAR